MYPYCHIVITPFKFLNSLNSNPLRLSVLCPLRSGRGGGVALWLQRAAWFWQDWDKSRGPIIINFLFWDYLYT